MQFVYGAPASVSYRLFSTYLRQSYEFHLNRNSAQLIGNALNEIHVFSHVLLTSALTLLTEAFVLVGIAAVLVAVEPLGAIIIVATVSVLALGFHLATRGALLRWGRARQLHEGRRIQHLQQGLGGVKDVLLLGREREFLEQYQVDNVGSAVVRQKQQTLFQMPRLGLELLAVIGLTVLVFIMLGRGAAVDAILPTMGLFAAAGFRIMPSVNRVINSIQNVRFTLPVIETLHQELALPNVPAESDVQPMVFENEIRLMEISFTYPGALRAALESVTLTIPHGTTVGFIGGSGAGKSTLVDVLLGLLPPDVGRVEVDGSDIAENPRGWQRNLGYVPQAIFLTDDSLRRNIAFGIPVDRIDDHAVWKAVKAAQLEEHIASLPDGLDTLVGERGIRLSGGQLQRIGIARALYHDPPVLVLDEATSALDTTTERGVMQAVGALHGRKTVIIIAHRMSTIANCDWVFRLEAGHMVDQGNAERMLGDTARGGFDRVAEGRR
jgi:ABC-type multidrug transport system fused ATPase/permease subunit